MSAPPEPAWKRWLDRLLMVNVLLVFIGSYLPLVTLQYDNPNIIHQSLVTIPAVANFCINPFIYAAKHPDLGKTIRSMLRCPPPRA